MKLFGKYKSTIVTILVCAAFTPVLYFVANLERAQVLAETKKKYVASCTLNGKSLRDCQSIAKEIYGER